MAVDQRVWSWAALLMVARWREGEGAGAADGAEAMAVDGTPLCVHEGPTGLWAHALPWRTTVCVIPWRAAQR